MWIDWQEAAIKADYNIKWECESGALYARARKPQVGYYLWDQWGDLAANAVRWGSNAAPTAGSFTNFTIPEDNFVPPRKIFNHEQPKRIMQVFPGLNNSDLQYYLRIPQGVPRGGFISNVGNPDSNFRFPYGPWFFGHESDIDNPTNAGEFWVPPKTDLEHAVLNTYNEHVRAQCMYVTVQFEVDPYDPRTEEGKKMIMGILKGNIPVRDGSIGGNNYFNMPENSFADAFKVPPVKWNGIKATYLENGNPVTVGGV